MRFRTSTAGMVMVLALTVAVPAPSGARAGFKEPVPSEGMVFPVARSNWYSVISFTHDWHLPRLRKIEGRWRLVGYHEGNDIFAEPGTPIHAVIGGRVEAAGWLFYSGWRVGIRGDDGRYWFYAHMEEPPVVVTGQRVAAGDVIGAVGNTGYGEAPGHRDEFLPHLHLGISESGGTWTDPYPLLRRLYRRAVNER